MKTFLSYSSVLIHRDNNKLYLTGIKGDSNDIIENIKLNIILKENEKISKFYCRHNMIIILTDAKKLYVNLDKYSSIFYENDKFNDDIKFNKQNSYNFICINDDVNTFIAVHENIIYTTSISIMFYKNGNMYSDNYINDMSSFNICVNSLNDYEIVDRDDHMFIFGYGLDKYHIIAPTINGMISEKFGIEERNFHDDYYIDHHLGKLFVQRDDNVLIFDSITKKFIPLFNREINLSKISYDSSDENVQISYRGQQCHYMNMKNDISLIINEDEFPIVSCFHHNDKNPTLITLCNTVSRSETNYNIISHYNENIMKCMENCLVKFGVNPTNLIIISDVNFSEKIKQLNKYFHSLYSSNDDMYHNVLFTEFAPNMQSSPNAIILLSEKSDAEYHLIILNVNEIFVGKCIIIEKYIDDSFLDDEEDDYMIDYSLCTHSEDDAQDENYFDINLRVGETLTLDRYLMITRLVDIDNPLSICITNRSKTIASGNGPTRQYITDALVEFKNKYIDYVGRNFYGIFNEAFNKLDEDDKYYYGVLFRNAVLSLSCELPFHLPINVIEKIKGKKIQLRDLEQFAEYQDEDLFKIVNENKDSDYEEVLKHICNYNEINIDSFIEGFKDSGGVKNSDQMNMITIDYYLSGLCKYDRNTFIILINFIDYDNENNKDYEDNYYEDYYNEDHYYEIDKNNEDVIQSKNVKKPIILKDKSKKKIFIEFIKFINEDQFKILLRNWSGTSIIQHNTKYTVNVQDVSKIMIGTCDIYMSIPGDIIHEDNFDYLINALCVRMDDITD